MLYIFLSARVSSIFDFCLVLFSFLFVGTWLIFSFLFLCTCVMFLVFFFPPVALLPMEGPCCCLIMSGLSSLELLPPQPQYQFLVGKASATVHAESIFWPTRLNAACSHSDTVPMLKRKLLHYLNSSGTSSCASLAQSVIWMIDFISCCNGHDTSIPSGGKKAAAVEDKLLIWIR